MMAMLEQSTRALAALKNGDDGLVEVDLGNGIKARMTLADAKAYALSQAPTAAPFDPGPMNIADLTDRIGELESADEMRLLLAAEETGKNRKGALEAISEALEILEA